MFLHIYEPSTGVTLVSRRLAPQEILDCEAFAHEWARQTYYELAPSDGYIPAGCGDIRVEIRQRKNDSVCIWAGEDYFLNHDIDF